MSDTTMANSQLIPLVQLSGLTKVYQEGEQSRVVLTDVHATVQRGELAVLLGPSGSGKSTLLNLISGVDLPTSGNVVIDSTNLTALTEKKRTLFRRKHIGLVFQFFNLIATLTVEENLLLPLSLNGITGKEAKERAMELLDAVSLADRAGSFPDRLSGGEQQRVAIARALSHDPLLVLADEPTGNLDAETGHQIMSLLEQLVRTRGKTAIVVTHRTDVARLADRVFTIREGSLEEVAAEDTPLKSAPAHSDLGELPS